MQKIIIEILQKISDRRPQAAFAVEFWDGAGRKFGHGQENFKIILKSEKTIKKILAAGSLGFGEEYMRGNIEVAGDIQAMLEMYDEWVAAVKNSLPVKMGILLNRAFSRHTISGAKKNAAYHYDIGNDFYSQWLDRTMTYSCAYFKNENDGLEAAQNNKYDHICRKLQIKAGDKLLDIGCGWGQMMFYAAKNYGAKCVGYTLSKNQYDYVQAKIESENLADAVAIRLEDYRRASGVFDKFVSIGMFEHIGKNYQEEFFKTVKKTLKPRGIGLLHTIGSKTGGQTDPWIAKYIFPGGYIPALPLIAENMNKADLIFYDIEDLRLHYGKTIDFWINNFENNAATIEKTLTAQFRDQIRARQFMRMWRLYLNASAASFKNGGNRLYQIIFSNGSNNNLPLTRDYIYSV